MSLPNPTHKRVLLKISGEMLGAATGESIGAEQLGFIASEIGEAAKLGCQIGLVVGGGNIVRGAAFAAQQKDWRVKADQMGMLATVINAMAIHLELSRMGTKSSVLSAWPVGPVCPTFTAEHAVELLESGHVVILAAGTGNPYFTTDTASALRAIEISADILLKATKVDGVYDSDPEKNPAAERFDVLPYREAVARNLRVMDQTAFALCRENGLPILVFDLLEPGNIAKAIAGEQVGTLVKED